MCTAIRTHKLPHLFGRTLDLERSFGEGVIITPREHPLYFVNHPPIDKHFAIIGTAIESDGTALYFDAMNEKGLADCYAASVKVLEMFDKGAKQ